MQNTAIIPGSIGALAQHNHTSLAESFLSAEAIILIDVSGSMATKDSRGGKSRFDVAIDELKGLQASLPGRIAVVSFSDHAQFDPGGVPEFQGSGTDLVAGLRFIKVADVPGIRFILISDGQPDAPNAALSIAAKFTNRIDVIYVGPEGSPTGRDFLQQLASCTGGKTVTADCAKELQPIISQLLLHT